MMQQPSAAIGEDSPPDDDPRWRLWGPYLSNREWGTIRQTDGPEGANWTKCPYERAAGTAYRYCEDGIFGVSDRDCRVCHAYAFWNYRDDHLKERFYGLANQQGAHGEDVKEMYYYKAADPQYRYICSEYLYPQLEYPYKHLASMEHQLKARGASNGAVSIADFNNNRTGPLDRSCFEIEFEMSKLTPDQLYFQLTITNNSSQTARIVAMPMLFLRNTWAPGQSLAEDVGVEKVIEAKNGHLLVHLKDAGGSEAHLGYYYDTDAEVAAPEVLLTHNATRQADAAAGHFKDSFDRYIVHGDGSELLPNLMGSKASKAGICYRLKIGAGQQVRLRSFLLPQGPRETAELNWRGLTASMETVKLTNLIDTYKSLPTSLVPVEQDILSAAYTTLLWNRQYYPLDLMSHLCAQLPPGRQQLPTRLVTVPDKWEQPYLAAWDTALHCLCLGCFDRRQAQAELMLLLALIRPDGSMYCDEYRPDGVTPPLVALAAVDVYGKSSPEEQVALGPRIYGCLKRHLHWWLHRTDARGVALVEGGVCGVDYVSLFPRELVETGEGLIWAAFFIMRFLELSLAIYSTPGCSCEVASQICQDLPILVGYLGRLCAAFTRDFDQDGGLFFPRWMDVAAATAAAAPDEPNVCGGCGVGNFNSDGGDGGGGGGGEAATTATTSDEPGGQRNRNSRTRFSSVDSTDGSSFSDFFLRGGGVSGGGSSVGDDSCGAAAAAASHPGEKQRCRWLHAYCYLPVICCCSLPNVRLPPQQQQQQQQPSQLLSQSADDSSDLGAATSVEELFAMAFNGPADWQVQAPYVHSDAGHSRLFVSLLSTAQLAEVLEQVLSEFQFLSQYGIRTLSLLHTVDAASVSVVDTQQQQSYYSTASAAAANAAAAAAAGQTTTLPHRQDGGCSGGKKCAKAAGVKMMRLVQGFCSGAAVSATYGGNTNWYGAVNLPYNFLLLDGLVKWASVLDGKLDLIECPAYSGKFRRLRDIVQELAARNVALFVPDGSGVIPSTGDDGKRGLLLYETFDGDTGRGHGAAHKGGWSAIIARILLLQHGIGV